VSVANFLASGVLELGDKLGPVLWQFPERLRFEPGLLADFLAVLPGVDAGYGEIYIGQIGPNQDAFFEFWSDQLAGDWTPRPRRPRDENARGGALMADPDLSPDLDPPDPVESDPAALNSAEDLDEDRLDVDPLEKGMDPPEHWSAADRRGMTPREQATPAPLDERLAEEQPDVGSGDPVPDDVDAAVETPTPDATDEELPRRRTYDEELGTSADVAGGSMADEIRTPPPAR
jgi:hypothetical protein